VGSQTVRGLSDN